MRKISKIDMEMLLPTRERCRNGSSPTNGAFVFEKARPSFHYSVCYGWFLRYKIIKTNLCYFVDFNHQFLTGREYTRKEKTYLNWLLNKSCWRDIYLIKNLKEIAKLGQVYDTNFPVKFVIQGAILTRYLVEFPQIPEMWNKLIRYVEPHLALVIAHDMIRKDKLYFIIRKNIYAWHSAWNHNQITKEILQKIIRGNPDFKTSLPMSKSCDYNHINQIWGATKKTKGFEYPKGKMKGQTVFGYDTTTETHSFHSLRKFIQEFLKLNGLEDLEVKHGSK
tara:strand:- start:163 stop:996 length:834 start_codon:yes stop_codon:yes gene_type:complete